MSDVKHMKWWGWGVDGVAFHHENKPGFAPFVKKNLGLDLTKTKGEPPAFDDIDVPSSRAPEAFVLLLTGVVGDEHVETDDMSRVVHTFGKSIRDLIRVRTSAFPRAVDVVVYPANEAEVRLIVDAVVAADAVLIPFGGGSNIAGSLEPLPAETRTVISLDLGRLRLVTSIDAEAGLAVIQAGAQGPDLEKQLNDKGWTIGHFPDSFTHSTVGGWVATRSSGMQSDKYGDIADIARGLHVARPDGLLVLRPLPSTSSGPSVREMILGSEGRLGVITEVTAQVHRIPAKRDVYAYFFPNWDAGIKTMQQISESDAAPSITRISDANETGFSLATSKDRKGLDKFMAGTALPKIMEAKWGKDLSNICISFIGYEGSPEHADRQRKLTEKIIRKHDGITFVGTGPGILYDQKKFDTPYLRDFLLDMGAAGDVSETAAPWSKLNQVHDAAYAAAQKAYDEIGIKGWIMSHMSHSYHSGACLYFTFAFVFKNDPIAEYNLVKNAIQQSFVDNHATISHHHGVGVEHSPWLEDDISAEGVVVMNALFAGVDPGSNFNPGKITQVPGAEKSAGGSARLGITTATAKKAPARKPAAAKVPAATTASAAKATTTRKPAAKKPAAPKA